jgi:sporulation protein YlmC with PRC-barrel domain
MADIILKQLFRSIIIVLFFCAPLLTRAAESSDMILASEWIDREIYGKNGKQFGEIDDLVIKRSGKIKKVTIEVGGFLDIGDKLVAVSLSELQNLMVKKDDKMVLDTTEQQMEKRSEFNYYDQGLQPDYYYRRKYWGYRYHYFPRPYPRSMTREPHSSRGRMEPYPNDEPYAWTFSPARFLASTIIDRQVINESGDYIGRVADLLIDTQDEKVKKIIIRTEDIRGDESHVAITYEPPGLTAYGIVRDISREEIRNLPDYHYGKQQK